MVWCRGHIGLGATISRPQRTALLETTRDGTRRSDVVKGVPRTFQHDRTRPCDSLSMRRRRDTMAKTARCAGINSRAGGNAVPAADVLRRCFAIRAPARATGPVEGIKN